MQIEPIIKAQSISVKKAGNIILKDISFNVSSGEFIGIVGPNGAGKTTLLNVLLNLEKPTKGKVTFHSCSEKNHKSSCCIGYVPQHLAVNKFNLPMTVEELLMTGLENPRNKNSKEKIKNCLKKVQIKNLSKRNIQNLSGGERQKALLARALVNNPKILFLDEPMSAIDDPSKQKFYELLKNLNKDGMTIVMVSHDLGMIVNQVTRILCLNRILHQECHTVDLKEGDIKKIFSNQNFIHHHDHA